MYNNNFSVRFKSEKCNSYVNFDISVSVLFSIAWFLSDIFEFWFGFAGISVRTQKMSEKNEKKISPHGNRTRGIIDEGVWCYPLCYTVFGDHNTKYTPVSYCIPVVRHFQKLRRFICFYIDFWRILHVFPWHINA